MPSIASGSASAASGTRPCCILAPQKACRAGRRRRSAHRNLGRGTGRPRRDHRGQGEVPTAGWDSRVCCRSRARPVAASDAPKGALTDPDALIGKTLAAPVAENQMMTPLTAVAPRTGVSPGHVIAPLRLGDAALGPLLRPGDVVDVIAANTDAQQAVVVAAGARIVTIPDLPDERAGPGPDGALVLIDVDAQTASAVAQAAAAATLSVIWR